MPFLSIVVPVFDDCDSLEVCLVSIRHSTYKNYEVLVADDGSADGPAAEAVVQSYGARLVRLDINRGPAAARNAAARAATGDVLIFIDADVTVHPDTLERFAAAFQADPGLDALMGSYDLHPKVRGNVAVFRNLLHAHVHHRSASAATTFWAGCGGVRRDRFLELGGFAESYRQPSIEDVEFGMRLYEAGGRLALDPAIQVSHHKEWTLASMIKTDTVHRAMPWTEMVMRHGWPRGLNFRWQDRLSAMATVLFLPLAFLGVRYGAGWSALALACLVLVAILQWPLFRFLAEQRGVAFSMVSFPIYLVHQLSAGAGFLCGLCRWEFTRDRWAPWVAPVLALLIFLGVQLGGGAYTAEFDAYPDEPAQFMTGLMLHDFLVQWPLAHPIAWAEQYYLHYPKVALTHWPPLFHIMEAVWWLFLPPSRVSALLLIGVLGLAAAVGFYRLARELVHPAVAAITAALLVATPTFQQSAAQVMADLPTLVFGVLTIGALARFLTGRDGRAPAEAGLWCTLCLLVKGTGACLVPAVLVMFVRRRPSWRILLILSGAIAFVAAWSGMAGDLVGWAGLRLTQPWGIPFTLSLAGRGVAALAVGGFLTLVWKREPIPVAAAIVTISIAAVAFFLRAMNEPRHWILILPPMFLLSLTCLRRLWEIPSRTVAGLAALGALALFPWSQYRQQPAGYAQLARSVTQPARMLVSAANGWYEGSWVVLASLRERRPSSVIVRATKVLSRSNWNGGHYRLLAATPAAVENALDRFGIETVILDDRLTGVPALAHQRILREALTTTSAWRQSGVSGQLSAWRRVRPPAAPREPLTLDLTWSAGRKISEQ